MYALWELFRFRIDRSEADRSGFVLSKLLCLSLHLYVLHSALVFPRLPCVCIICLWNYNGLQVCHFKGKEAHLGCATP
jgi:hypothetical protein